MRQPLRRAASAMALGLLAAVSATAARAQVSNETHFPFVEGAPSGGYDARPGERPGDFRRDRDDDCLARIPQGSDEKRKGERRCSRD